MSTRGRRPKPLEIKRLDGNPGKRPLNDAAPVVKAGPVMPDYLTDYAEVVWRRIVAAMPEQVYRATDSALLAAYCQAAALHRAACAALETAPEVVAGPGGAPYQNPWVSIQNRQARLMASLGSRLGLDPAARQRLQAAPGDNAPKSKFAGLYGAEDGAGV